MTTAVIKITSGRTAGDVVRDGAAALNDGGLVAFPTETVYGLAVRADMSEAIARLRRVKNRLSNQAFTVHLGHRDEVSQYAPELDGLAGRLIRKGWPGPMTLILPVPDPTKAPVAGRLDEEARGAIYYENSVGLRCPDHLIAEQLLKAVDAPVIAASANPAGIAAPRSGDEVLAALGNQVDVLIDDGPTRYGKPSTIVRVKGNSYEILRKGVYDAGVVERMSTLRLLFVCTGNTCRSPMAAALAKKRLAKRIGCHPDDLAAAGVVVESAGTAVGWGRASEHAVTLMASRDLDISTHRSRELSKDMLLQADFIFAMTRSHLDTIGGMLMSAEGRTSLLLGQEDLTDPMGSSVETYKDCAETIDAALQTCLKEVRL